jgi:hypothetical protein
MLKSKKDVKNKEYKNGDWKRVLRKTVIRARNWQFMLILAGCVGCEILGVWRLCACKVVV